MVKQRFISFLLLICLSGCSYVSRVDIKAVGDDIKTQYGTGTGSFEYHRVFVAGAQVYDAAVLKTTE